MDYDCLCCLICGGIAPALDRNGSISGVVIDSITFVQLPLFLSKFRFPELCVNQCQIVMRRDVLLIEFKGSAVAPNGFIQKLPLSDRISSFELGALE